MTEQRRDERDSLFLLAAMRLADQAETLRIKVRNLSRGGMMAECPVHVERGERLHIDLRNVGWIGGTVTWVLENRFGVAFDREIDCKAVRQPVASSDDVPEMCVRRPLVGALESPPQPEPGNLRWI
jgi:hypothetical protein